MRTVTARQNLAQYEEWQAEYEMDAIKARARADWAEAAIYDAQARLCGKFIADLRYAFDDIEEEAARMVAA